MLHHSRSKSPLRNILAAFFILSSLYGIVVSILLLVRKQLTEDNKIVSYFNAFAHMLMLPALVLLPLNLVFRRRWVALAQVIPTAVFISAYGRFFLPRKPTVETPSSRQLKILTFNIHSEAEVLEPMLAILRECDADIISLQELSAEAAECFHISLSDLYPYRALHTNHRANSGQGVLSRFPITSQAYWQNPNIARKILGHLRVEMDIDGTTVTVYNTHPIHPGMSDDGFSTRPRGAEIDVVLAQVAHDTGPILIMGDFNMTDQSEDYQRITAQFEDSFGATGYGMGFTFPDLSTFQSLPGYWPLPVRLFPFLRLDYIFYNSAFQPIKAYAWPTSGGSDHRPVLAILSLVNGNTP